MEAMVTKKDTAGSSNEGISSAYEHFHIVVHGTLMILLDEKTLTAQIRVPFDACHYFIAACLDEGGKMKKVMELEKETYTLTPTLLSNGGLQIGLNDSDRMVVGFSGAHGPAGWCVIEGLPWPEKLWGWRRFPANILNTAGQTYQHSGLDAVNTDKGIPMVYVLHYGQQPSDISLTDTKGKSMPIESTSGVGRLHIFAEGRDSVNHDAISTLNSCANPAFDINVKRCTPDEKPDLEPSPDSTVGVNEQRTLDEQNEANGQTLTQWPPLPCCQMISSDDVNLGHPRTCMPLIGFSRAATGSKHMRGEPHRSKEK